MTGYSLGRRFRTRGSTRHDRSELTTSTGDGARSLATGIGPQAPHVRWRGAIPGSAGQPLNGITSAGGVVRGRRHVLRP